MEPFAVSTITNLHYHQIPPANLLTVPNPFSPRLGNLESHKLNLNQRWHFAGTLDEIQESSVLPATAINDKDICARRPHHMHYIC